MMKRKKRTVDDIVRVELDDGTHTYARVLPEATFAFYDCRTKQELPPDQIILRPILFKIAVMNHAVTKGRWLVIGHAPVDEALATLPCKFIQDPINPAVFSIYENGNIRAASRAECLGLERAAVWEPEHVEDRLRDHYAGRPNIWVE
jgi:hypothetical protein